jgi:hypothetical protein
MATADKILLGYGVVTVGGTAIGLTRGGSVFAVEREYRNIEADGDKGPVKGRIMIDSEVGKLTVNALELFTAADMKKYYPGTSVTAVPTETPTTDVFTSTLSIVSGDHNDVVWTGKTKDGKAVTITIKDALNMGNLEWTLEDKNEVVPSLEFTATYSETNRELAPWSVVFAR